MSITVPAWRAGTCVKCQEFTEVNHDDECRRCQDYEKSLDRYRDLKKEPEMQVAESPLRKRRRELVAAAKLKRYGNEKAY